MARKPTLGGRFCDARTKRAYPKLDSSRARLRLGWRQLASLEDAIASVAAWYEALDAGADVRSVTLEEIGELTSARR